MRLPERPRTFKPDFTIDGPARRKRNRTHLFITLGVLGGLVVTRALLRFSGVL